MSRPHSAKMMAKTTQKAISPRFVSSVSGFSQSGPRAETRAGPTDCSGASNSVSSSILGHYRHRVQGADNLGVAADQEPVGVGPHPQPWPTGDQWDPELLAQGDRRNVVDRYRYWRMDAIVTDLRARRHQFHVAIENFDHDFNIGSVVRTANAFAAHTVHVIGRRRWNRRGAMVTDRYLDIAHHDDALAFGTWARQQQIPVIGIDNFPGAQQLETSTLPRSCILLFGQEGLGISPTGQQQCERVLAIAQFGSTRSINAGAAAAIAMHAWIQQHCFSDVVR